MGAACVSSLACSSDHSVNIGGDGDSATAATGEYLKDYAATWDGYAEAYEFPSGSSRVRITLDEHGHGTVRFGEQELAAPPTDPDSAPPVSQSNGNLLGVPLNEDFLYTVEESQVSDQRIQFGVSNEERIKDWCELQTPTVWLNGGTMDEGQYSCLPNGSVRASDSGCAFDSGSGAEPMDCGKVALCRVPDVGCSCDAQGCGVTSPSELAEYPTRVDAALDDHGRTLLGTLLIGSERVSVRLTRK